jgi:hypothetical protein
LAIDLSQTAGGWPPTRQGFVGLCKVYQVVIACQVVNNKNYKNFVNSTIKSTWIVDNF